MSCGTKVLALSHFDAVKQADLIAVRLLFGKLLIHPSFVNTRPGGSRRARKTGAFGMVDKFGKPASMTFISAMVASVGKRCYA